MLFVAPMREYYLQLWNQVSSLKKVTSELCHEMGIFSHKDRRHVGTKSFQINYPMRYAKIRGKLCPGKRN